MFDGAQVASTIIVPLFSGSSDSFSSTSLNLLVNQLNEPNAIRSGLATFPVLLLNNEAYFCSKTSHGMLSAILIYRLLGFI